MQPVRMLNPRTSGKHRRFKKQPTSSRGGLRRGSCLILVTVETSELNLPSHIDSVAEAAAAVADFINRAGMGEEAAFGIDMAVREAVTNAVIHGNQCDESKTVELTLKSSPDGVEIIVHDQGPGFNPTEVPDPTKAENLLKTSGRGIFFMHSFMDVVDWLQRPEGGTTVRMVKRR